MRTIMTITIIWASWRWRWPRRRQRRWWRRRRFVTVNYGKLVSKSDYGLVGGGVCFRASCWIVGFFMLGSDFKLNYTFIFIFILLEILLPTNHNYKWIFKLPKITTVPQTDEILRTDYFMSFTIEHTLSLTDSLSLTRPHTCAPYAFTSSCCVCVC